MKKLSLFLLAITLLFSLAACGRQETVSTPSISDRIQDNTDESEGSVQDTTVESKDTSEDKESETMRIKITVGETELFATLEDNAASRALTKKCQ